MDAFAGFLGLALFLASIVMAIVQRKTRLKRWLVLGAVGLVVCIGALGSESSLVSQTVSAVNAALDQGDYDAADSIVAEALERSPKNAELQELLTRIASERMTVSAQAYADGLAALDAGWYEDAIELLERVVADDPNYSDAQVKLSAAKDVLARDYYDRGLEAKRQEDYAEAEHLFVLAKGAGGEVPTDLETQLTEATRLREEQEAAAAAEAERARQEAERIAAILGPKPENSPWDGAVEPVMQFLRANLLDPKSLDIIEWSPVSAITWEGEPYWGVRCKYRAKNAFGGYVIENQLFLMRQQAVVHALDY